MRPQAPPKPHNRDGTWYLVRRVPSEYAALDKRGIVKLTTKIPVAADPKGRHAARVVKQLDAELEAYWRGLADGRQIEAQSRFDDAQRRARALNLPYMTADELAAGPLDEILRRVKILTDRDSLEDAGEFAAVLGGEPRPVLRLSGLVEEVEKLQSTVLKAMSEEQKRKWRNPKKLAVANFTEAIDGRDKPIAELTRFDTLAFRRWWQQRIDAEEVDVGTANKNIGAISGMVRVVDDAYQLNLKPIFARLRLEGQIERQRAAFTAEFVQNNLYAEGALAGLNDEARHLVFLIAETGMRLSEAAGLHAENIVLDHAVPHVQVRPIGRLLKTPHSARDIPLVGAALAVMKLHPQGFPRYRGKDALSATVNKYLDENGLLPSPEHSLYSLRHCFEDRLTAVEAPEKLVAALMGHKWHRPKYGTGPSLEQKRDWLQKIAFTAPKHL